MKKIKDGAIIHFLLILCALLAFSSPLVADGYDLSRSTKRGEDASGNGELSPGEILYYIINITNIGNETAFDVTVEDQIPPMVHDFAVLDLPAGACDQSEGPPAGDNGTGFLEVGCIDVPPGEMKTILFKVVIDEATGPGSLICN